ncbi:vanadium-dependent haloperoxidase [Anaeromyxobacter sp. Red801]|uniref:vanadium-dependent haloperoxidase n=1 Tax=Anaeromyxobacter sp. Red801 TaxID=3411632 RepID=UPI003B9E570D
MREAPELVPCSIAQRGPRTPSPAVAGAAPPGKKARTIARRRCAALALGWLATACLAADEAAAGPPAASRSAVLAANAVTTWHAYAQDLVAGFPGRGNAAQAYTASLIQVAVYDAVVAIRGRYPPFLAPVPAPAGADLDAAVATAAYRVGITRVNAGTSRTAFQDRYTAFLAAIPDGAAKAGGVAVGEAAAQAVLAARSGDHFYDAAVFANPPADPGVWQATPVANAYATAGASDYAMAFVMPLTAASPGARRAPPPPNLRSARYADALAEVREYGRKESAARTAAMTDVVQFWTESGFTLWQRNTRDLVAARNLDELETARALAAIGVAGGEAMLACFESKYHYLSWRPFQAIQRADEDGNRRTEPEPLWTPLVRANHPEYPAGHGCYGSAMATALRLLFGEMPVTLTSTGGQVAGWPQVPSRSYASLAAIPDENADARVWGGLHLRTTMEQSARWIRDVTDDALCGRFGIACE